MFRRLQCDSLPLPLRPRLTPFVVSSLTGLRYKEEEILLVGDRALIVHAGKRVAKAPGFESPPSVAHLLSAR